MIARDAQRAVLHLPELLIQILQCLSSSTSDLLSTALVSHFCGQLAADVLWSTREVPLGALSQIIIMDVSDLRMLHDCVPRRDSQTRLGS